MGNEDLTKLARWVVPGWVALLSFCVFVIIDVAVSSSTPGPYIFPSLSALITNLTAMDKVIGVLATILIAASGVPIGFMIYQVYFFLRWNSPYSRDGLLALIPGRMRDIDLALLDLTADDITLKEKWRQRWVEHPLFRTDHRFKWRYVELLFTEGTQYLDRAGASVGLYARHRYLHEIVHTLGASIGAVYFGFAGYMILVYDKKEVYLPAYAAITTLCIGILVYLMDRENRYREEQLINLFQENRETEEQTKNQENQRLPLAVVFPKRFLAFSYPSVFFVIALYIVNIFANPYLNHRASSWSPYDTFFRMALLAFVSLIWALSPKSPPPNVQRGHIVLVIITLGIALLAKYWFSHLHIDWAFASSLTVFITLNLILFQNRRNAKGDMTALEYHVLRRYIAHREKKEIKEEKTYD
ncbi:MAG: hypothetical protein D6690_16995 [Nitrospirae bacterium]|nr:MAG: hypothetical protein D6690_16995 [Nitrospirota bacterium]